MHRSSMDILKYWLEHMGAVFLMISQTMTAVMNRTAVEQRIHLLSKVLFIVIAFYIIASLFN